MVVELQHTTKGFHPCQSVCTNWQGSVLFADALILYLIIMPISGSTNSTANKDMDKWGWTNDNQKHGQMGIQLSD